MTKKVLLIGGLLFLCCVLYLYRGVLLAKLSPEFRFEKYKVAEEAKAELLRLHPVGTPQSQLVQTLKSAGATIEYIVKKDLPYQSWIEKGAEGAIELDPKHRTSRMVKRVS